MDDPSQQTADENHSARAAWDANAAFWDAKMGDGNDFFHLLEWPPALELLAIHAGDRVIDLACGNGLTSFRLAELGAHVIAIDFAPAMLDAARQRNRHDRVDYRLLDACDADAMATLGSERFDAALSNMALMDMADVGTAFRSSARLLRAGGRFVFSIVHPCFNNPASVQTAELVDDGGTFKTVYAAKVARYLTPFRQLGAAMDDQPVPHPYFHRPLQVLFKAGFEAGFVLDGLRECSFAPGTQTGTSPLSWSGHFSEIPPILVARMRKR
jgi:SAM-dependent methyltransferase